jgi:hypothetical protein
MKTRKILAIVVLALCLMVFQAQLSEAAPMGTAFTYQGRLIDANSPANGLYDLQFKLYDANVAGTQKGSTINIGEVDVIDGYFTVKLDFGSEVFDGNECWLDVGVRPGDLNDPNVYTTLSPRQEVTPKPYALYAATAQTAGTDNDWIISGNNMYSGVSGNVGIGTTGPDDLLTIRGACAILGMQYTAAEAGGGIPIYFYNDNGTRNRIAAFGGVTETANTATGRLYLETRGSGDSAPMVRLTVDSTGNVGIGTTEPAYPLTVQGTSILQKLYSTSGSGPYIDFQSQGVREWEMGVNNSGSDGKFLIQDVTSAATRFLIDSSGNVGIGTTAPTEKLDVNGKARIRDLSPGWPDDVVVTADTTGVLRSGGTISGFGKDKADWYDVSNPGYPPTYINNDIYKYGNVGIGVTDPGESLDVIGTARLRGIIGGSGTVVVADGNGKLWKSSSSKRYKTDIANLENNPNAVLQLRPVRFRWKTTGQEDIGLIAEEVDEVIKDLVIYDKEGRPDAVKYDKVVLHLLAVVKTQQERIAALEETVAQNESLRQKVDVLEAKMQRLELIGAKEAQQ